MLADIDDLERLLIRAYAGRDLAGSEARWRKAMQYARERISGPATPLEFRDVLLQALSFVTDNHFVLWLYDDDGFRHWRATAEHRTAHVARVRRGRGLRCEGRPRPVTVWSAQGQPVQARVRFAPGDVSCHLPDGRRRLLTPRTASLSEPLEPVFARRRLAGVPWIRVRSLGAGHQRALGEFVGSAEEVRKKPVVLLDLRGNTGGSDRFLLRWFERLTNQPLDYYTTHELRSELTLQGRATFWHCAAQRSETQGADAEWLAQLASRARRRASRRDSFLRWRIRHYQTHPKAQSAFRGRLVVWVDRRCSSACETAVMLARQIPGALVVGENTEGTMRVGEIGWFLLKRSRVWLSLGRRVHLDPETGHAFPEAMGYMPDLWFDGADGTPKETMGSLLRCMKRSRCRKRIYSTMDASARSRELRAEVSP